MTDASPTLPADWYSGSERYERERSHIFANEWLWYASAAEVATPCTYVAREYAGWPLMVVRGNDGVSVVRWLRLSSRAAGRNAWWWTGMRHVFR